MLPLPWELQCSPLSCANLRSCSSCPLLLSHCSSSASTCISASTSSSARGQANLLPGGTQQRWRHTPEMAENDSLTPTFLYQGFATSCFFGKAYSEKATSVCEMQNQGTWGWGQVSVGKHSVWKLLPLIWSEEKNLSSPAKRNHSSLRKLLK